MARLDRSPRATFARIGTSTRATVDRIVCTYLEATDDQRQEGAEWYADAGEVAADIASAAEITREHAAAVISHLSPRTPWTRNLSGAWNLVITGAAPGCLQANIRRARAALESTDPLATFTGPKTSRFVRNILGDRSVVTVDVWAMRVALGDRPDVEQILSRVGVYDAIEHAYRLAADRLGVDPVTVQATTWIVARGRSGLSATQDVRDHIELATAGW